MNKEIILTPEELYYLGGLMQARSIDYAYVSAIRDTKKSYKLIAQESKAKLVDAGILMEDFGGERTLAADARFIFVALDEDGNKVQVPPLLIETPEEQALFDEAVERRKK